MARKPLIDLETVSFNRCESNSQFAHDLLVSGDCQPVKQKVVELIIKNNTIPVIVINMDQKSTYIKDIEYDYSINGDRGYDLFSSMTIRQACAFFRDAAHEKNYSTDQVVQIIKYLELIRKLNADLGLNINTIEEINAYYYSPEIINKAVNDLFISGKINREERDRYLMEIIRSIKGQIIIEDMLGMFNFSLNSGAKNFSVNNLKSGPAFIDLVQQHNSVTENDAISSVLYSIEEYKDPMMVLLNIGKSDLALVKKFMKNMIVRKTCRLIVIVDDIFAQAEDYECIRHAYPFNILGKHTGESARKMSNCFHETYRMDKQYSCSVDHRLRADNFMDILLRTNYTETTTLTPVRRNIIEQEDIVNLSERAFIMINNTGIGNYFTFHSL